MYACILCRWLVELDDVIVAHQPTGRCICLRCYAREVGDEHPLPRALRREIEAALPA